MLPGVPRARKFILQIAIIYLVAAIVFVIATSLVAGIEFPTSRSEMIVRAALNLAFLLFAGLVTWIMVYREMRQRAQVETELRERAALLNQAEAIAQLGSWHWDYQTNQLTWSEGMFKLFGLQAAEFSGDPDTIVTRFVHPDDREKMLQLNKSVRSERRPIAMEYRIVSTTGEVRMIYGDGLNIYNRAGEPVALIGILQDITERKNAEEAVRLQSAALAAAANAIAITDQAGQVTWVNPAFVQLTGYDLQTILGKDIRILNTAEHDHEAYMALWNTILAGEVWHGEIINQRRDGSLYVEELTVTPLRDAAGSVTHFIAISQDVSERRWALEALRESEARFRRLSDNAPDIIYRYRLTPEPGLDYVSPAITAITGYTPAELYQQPQLLGAGVYPEDRQTFATAAQRQMFTLRIFHKDGRTVWLEQRHVPVFDETGNMVAVEGVARDITEQKTRERELDAIARISIALRQAATRAEALPLVLEQVRTVFEAGDTCLMTLDTASGALFVELGLGDFAGPLTGRRLPPGNSISRRVLETGQPYVSNDIQHDPDFVWLAAQPAQSWAAVCVPLTVQGRTSGVLWVYHPTRFSSLESQLLGAVADITATALQRISLLEEAQQRAEQLTILNEVGNTLSETLALNEILSRLAKAIQKLLPDVASVFVSLYDLGTSLITVAYGLHDQEPVDVSQLTPVPLESTSLNAESEVIRTGQFLIVNDVERRFQSGEGDPSGPTAQSALYVPLKAKSATIGVLQVQSYTSNRFSAAEAELLSLVGATAAIAIQNARLFAENMERMETMTALYVSAQKLSFDRDQARLLDDVLRTCIQGYGADATLLARVEADGSLRPLVFHPPDSPYFTQLSSQRNGNGSAQTPADRAVASGFAVVLDDSRREAANAPWQELMQAHHLRSYIALPLISRDEPIGVLCLFSQQASFFKPSRQSFLQAYAHHVATALENARLIAETGRRLRQLQSLRAIDAAITGSLDLRLNLKIILDQAITQLGSDAVDLLILNKNTLTLEFSAGRGFLSNTRAATRLQVGQGLAGQVALTRRTLSIPALAQHPPHEQSTAFAAEGFVAYMGLPLIAKGQVTGVLEIFHRRPFTPDAEWLEFVKSLSEQSAIAIDNATLFVGLQRTNLELALAYDATIEGWSRAMDLRDKETEGHTQRVTELAVSLASRLGVVGEALVHLRRGALLHDIGKMGVPDYVLLKPGPLTDEEWVLMKLHPTYAYEMLSAIAYLRPAIDIPYCHHEKWDGTGYPRGLKGEQIPLAARIFAVVDVWDTIRSDRPYRPAWPQEQARAHIASLAGVDFEPGVVDSFLSLVQT